MGPEKRHRENGRRGEHRPCVLTMRGAHGHKMHCLRHARTNNVPLVRGSARVGTERGESVGSDLKAKPTHGSFVSSWPRGEFVHSPSALATTDAMPGDTIHAPLSTKSSLCENEQSTRDAVATDRTFSDQRTIDAPRSAV